MSHALGLDMHMWDELAMQLAADRPVLRYDHRGHGGSAVPPGPYTMDDLVEIEAGFGGIGVMALVVVFDELLEIGERKQGRALCERLLSLASSLDLYAEELEASTGRHLGNFPQAFTHLALINAVMHVIRDEQANPVS